MNGAEIFREWFGVPVAASKIVAALYVADGGEVTLVDMCAASGQTHQGVNQSLNQLRAAMDAESIINRHGRGWYLSVVGREDCAKAVRDAMKRGAA